MSLYSRIKFISLKLTFVFALLALFSSVYGQGLGNSPYTELGAGELYNDGFAQNQAMGGVGVAASSNFYINNINPALWVNARATMFEFGGIGQYKQAKSSSATRRDLGVNIANIALAFPVINGKWSSGFSLRPYSFVDYSSRSTGVVPGTIYEANYSAVGSGAINKASFTNGFRIWKFINAGLEASYLFGNTLKATEAALIDGNNKIVSLNERISYSDVGIKAGLSARIPLKRDKITKESKLNLNWGGTYTYGTNLSAKRTTTLEVTTSSFLIQEPDTILKNRRGFIGLPSMYRTGLTLEWPNLLSISADVERQAWSEYQPFERDKRYVGQSVNKFFVGAEFWPNWRSTKYFDLVTYRAGFSHGRMPFQIGNSEMTETTVSLGGSFPFGIGTNTVSISLIGGRRGAVSKETIGEYFGRVAIGITLVDRWFVKQKIE